MLMYSALFGLREVDTITDSAPLGTYIRCYGPTGDTQGWAVMDMKRERSGRGSRFFWKPVSVASLPLRLKAEALLLGVAL